MKAVSVSTNAYRRETTRCILADARMRLSPPREIYCNKKSPSSFAMDAHLYVCAVHHEMDADNLTYGLWCERTIKRFDKIAVAHGQDANPLVDMARTPREVAEYECAPGGTPRHVRANAGLYKCPQTGAVELRALRNIERGEEIVADRNTIVYYDVQNSCRATAHLTECDDEFVDALLMDHCEVSAVSVLGALSTGR